VVSAGCFAGQQDPYDLNAPLTKVFEVPTPVEPWADGGWHLVLPQVGVVGEGRALVRMARDGALRWSLQLPEAYALTGAPGGAHSFLHTDRGELLLLGGAAGVNGPASVRLVRLDTGETAWERRLPSDFEGRNLVTLDKTGFDEPTVVVSSCGATGCALAGWSIGDGHQQWKTTVAAAQFVARGTEPGLGGGGIDQRRPGEVQGWSVVFAVGPTWFRRVSTVDGKIGPAVPRPRGAVAYMIFTIYRLVVVTRPEHPGCVATVTSYALDNDLRAAWRKTLHWTDPRVPARSGQCRIDPSKPVMGQFTLWLPDVRGWQLVSDYDGTVKFRLDPEDYPLTDYMIWGADGHYRRIGPTAMQDGSTPSTSALAAVVPAGEPPMVFEAESGLEVVRDGDGLSACDYPLCGSPRWHAPGARAVLLLGERRMVFLGATSAVGVGPAPRTPA
jgi:hypothetical protein